MPQVRDRISITIEGSARLLSVTTDQGITHAEAVRLLTDAAYAEGEEPRERYACGTPYIYATRSLAGVMAVPETIVVIMPVRRRTNA